MEPSATALDDSRRRAEPAEAVGWVEFATVLRSTERRAGRRV